MYVICMYVPCTSNDDDEVTLDPAYRIIYVAVLIHASTLCISVGTIISTTPFIMK